MARVRSVIIAESDVYFLFFTTLAGAPPTITQSGTSFVTTLLAPTTEWEPIFLQGINRHSRPIHTSSPISVLPSRILNPCSIIGRVVSSMLCVNPPKKKLLGHIITSLPITIFDGS